MLYTQLCTHHSQKRLYYFLFMHLDLIDEVFFLTFRPIFPSPRLFRCSWKSKLPSPI